MVTSVKDVRNVKNTKRDDDETESVKDNESRNPVSGLQGLTVQHGGVGRYHVWG